MRDVSLHAPRGAVRHEAHLASYEAGGLDAAHPFSHPREVLDAPDLSASDKRALLASWASDACAVEGRPAWRRLPGSAELVCVDEILDALQALDRGGLH